MLRIPSSVHLGPRPRRVSAPLAEPPELEGRFWSSRERSPAVVDYGLLRRDRTALPSDATRDSDLAA